jgi:hypothetical protein
MKKALPLILIAGAVVAFMMYRKSQQPGEPLRLGPGPQIPSGAEKAAAEIKKVAKGAKTLLSKIKAARAKIKAQKSGTIGFDDNSVLV